MIWAFVAAVPPSNVTFTSGSCSIIAVNLDPVVGLPLESIILLASSVIPPPKMISIVVIASKSSNSATVIASVTVIVIALSISSNFFSLA